MLLVVMFHWLVITGHSSSRQTRLLHPALEADQQTESQGVWKRKKQFLTRSCYTNIIVLFNACTAVTDPFLKTILTLHSLIPC